MLQLLELKTVTCRRKTITCLLQYASDNKSYFDDVVLQAANSSLSANCLVLSCYCKYFEGKFDLKTRNATFFDFPNIDGNALANLIGFMYSGKIDINNKNVLEILSAADQLEMDEVKTFCFEFLEDCITPTNCFLILAAAKQFQNCILIDKLYKFISANYKTSVATQTFLTISYDEFFICILNLKQNFSLKDEDLLRSMMIWTKHNLETRKKRITTLMKFIDVKKLSYWLVQELLDGDLFPKYSDIYKVLSLHNDELTKTQSKILSVCGRYTINNVKIVYSLDGKTKQNYPMLPIQPRGNCAFKMNNIVYCIGGRLAGYSSSNKVWKLDLNQIILKWEESPSMADVRYNLDVCAYKQLLVVCGGFDGNTHLKSVEAYYADLKTWSFLQSLKQGRSGHKLVASGKSLYAIGGKDKKYCFTSVEKLSDLTGSWKFVSPMNTARCWFASVSCDNVLYVIGGADGDRIPTKTVEKYDSTTDKWSYENDMIIERFGHSACVLKGRIFVCGGWDAEGKPVREIESYNTLSNVWKIVGCTEDDLVDHSLVVV